MSYRDLCTAYNYLLLAQGKFITKQRQEILHTSLYRAVISVDFFGGSNLRCFSSGGRIKHAKKRRLFTQIKETPAKERCFKAGGLVTSLVPRVYSALTSELQLPPQISIRRGPGDEFAGCAGVAAIRRFLFSYFLFVHKLPLDWLMYTSNNYFDCSLFNDLPNVTLISPGK